MYFDVSSPDVLSEVHSLRDEVLALARLQQPNLGWDELNASVVRLFGADGLLAPEAAQVLRSYPEAVDAMDRFDNVVLDVDARLAALREATDEVRFAHPELAEVKAINTVADYFSGNDGEGLENTRVVRIAARLRGRQAGISTGRAHMDLAPLLAAGPTAKRNLACLLEADFSAIFVREIHAPAPASAPAPAHAAPASAPAVKRGK